MDIEPLSMVISQPHIQRRDDISVTKATSTDTAKENDKQIVEKIHNVAIDTNIGQNLDVVEGVQKDKNETANK
ncbi:hypothetical protein [Clostridium lacusfryxellense]|uniref:hypothetical protein n=1 Tax=Clostridium lacusfryxellense TaxID=205328 RepID=UPI001C0B5037|nr:hypothetical protein [Clostridium lacusfryxellense]MBU3111773.1 hypothetical protein [Clostridium lacusfryxellense]